MQRSAAILLSHLTIVCSWTVSARANPLRLHVPPDSCELVFSTNKRVQIANLMLAKSESTDSSDSDLEMALIRLHETLSKQNQGMKDLRTDLLMLGYPTNMDISAVASDLANRIRTSWHRFNPTHLGSIVEFHDRFLLIENPSIAPINFFWEPDDIAMEGLGIRFRQAIRSSKSKELRAKASEAYLREVSAFLSRKLTALKAAFDSQLRLTKETALINPRGFVSLESLSFQLLFTTERSLESTEASWRLEALMLNKILTDFREVLFRALDLLPLMNDELGSRCELDCRHKWLDVLDLTFPEIKDTLASIEAERDRIVELIGTLEPVRELHNHWPRN